MIYTTFDSPIGALLLAGDEDGLRVLSMQDAPRPRRIRPEWTRGDDVFADVRAQLDEYFDGARETFDVKLALHGNPFEQRVWRELLEIPYGETISYGQIAKMIGAPSAARAVGLANGRNPVALIVPCHRVIGANGSLTGYGGGLERKRFLLDLESGVSSLLSA
jgi:methylated-DNA-[protein]-cysteine S-methyltransferase